MGDTSILHSLAELPAAPAVVKKCLKSGTTACVIRCLLMHHAPHCCLPGQHTVQQTNCTSAGHGKPDSTAAASPSPPFKAHRSPCRWDAVHTCCFLPAAGPW